MVYIEFFQIYDAIFNTPTVLMFIVIPKAVITYTTIFNSSTLDQ